MSPQSVGGHESLRLCVGRESVFLCADTSEPVTSESFGLIQHREKTQMHTHTQEEEEETTEEKNPLTQTEMESLSLHYRLPLDRPFSIVYDEFFHFH